VTVDVEAMAFEVAGFEEFMGTAKTTGFLSREILASFVLWSFLVTPSFEVDMRFDLTLMVPHSGRGGCFGRR
jgi:hypothetical protein